MSSEPTPEPTPTPAPEHSTEQSIASKVSDKVSNIVRSGVTPTTESEKVSANAKVVVLGLFGLIAFLMAMFTVTTTAGEVEITDAMTTVFTGAISGAFTLGGVLITQIWGKSS